MALTEIGIQNLKPKKKPYRKADSGGLSIYVAVSGAKSWQYRYSIFIGDKRTEKIKTIGKYPQLSLKQARAEHKLLSVDVSKGIDVHEVFKLTKKKKPIIYSSFGDMAEKWLVNRKRQVSLDTANREWNLLKNNVLPKIQDKDIKELTPEDIFNIANKVGNVSVDKAKRITWTIGKVLEHARMLGRIPMNVSTGLAKGLGFHEVKNSPSIQDTELLGKWVYTMENNSSSKDTIGCYLRMIAHIGNRPGELADLKWAEIDFKNQIWNYEVGKTKRYGIKDFRIYLTDQVMMILEDCKKLNGDKENVFWSYGKKHHISSRGVQYRMEDLGFPRTLVVPNGFRSTQTTLGIDECKAQFEVVDLCLAHKPSGNLGDIYNKALRWDERVQFYKDWSDLLMKLKKEHQKSAIKIIK